MSYTISASRDLEFDLMIVVEHSGKVSRIYPEDLAEPCSLHTVVQTFLFGRYTDPVRVLAFNKAQQRSRDISKDIAEVVLQCALTEGKQLSETTRAFIEHHLTKSIGAKVNLTRLASGPFLPIRAL